MAEICLVCIVSKYVSNAFTFTYSYLVSLGSILTKIKENVDSTDKIEKTKYFELIRTSICSTISKKSPRHMKIISVVLFDDSL